MPFVYLLLVAVLTACSTAPVVPKKEFRHIRLASLPRTEKGEIDERKLILEIMKTDRTTALAPLSPDQRDDFNDLVKLAKASGKKLDTDRRLRKKWSSFIEDLEESENPIEVSPILMTLLHDSCFMLSIEYQKSMSSLIATDSKVKALVDQLATLKQLKITCMQNMGSSCDAKTRDEIESEIEAAVKELAQLLAKYQDEDQRIRDQEIKAGAIMCNLQKAADAFSNLSHDIIFDD
jgi:hypothetical protein